MDETTTLACEICLEAADPLSVWYQSFGCCSYRCSEAQQAEESAA